MAYEINFTDSINKGKLVIEDSTTNTDTSLDLPGRNTVNYGTSIAENFLHLMENFANTVEPTNPVEGQLWYDTSTAVNQLKLYDGTSWVAAGGLKKATTEPDVANSVVGDLWVDTDNQQLYLFTGSGWILVGPSFSDGLQTGAEPVIITGTDDTDYIVLQIDVEAQPVAIISTDTFTPKTVIPGFATTTIKPGINLSTNDIKGDGVAKFYGTAEKAESLLVGNTVVPATNFIRSDVAGITTKTLSIKNNNSLILGSSSEFALGVESGDGTITQNINGTAIQLRVNNNGSIKSVVTIASDKRVGINNPTPEQEIDVTGNIQASGQLFVNSTNETSAAIIEGGVDIGRQLSVGADASISGLLTTQNIAPTETASSNIGAENNRYDTIYSISFNGNLTGDVTGTVTGRATSADKLTSATTFKLIGDITAPEFNFDGQTGGNTKTFNTTLSNAIVSSKPQTLYSETDDEILINRIASPSGLYKISTRELLSGVPVNPAGVIMPYAGIISNEKPIPDNWLLCDGREVSKFVWPSLFAAIGYSFKDRSLLSDAGETNFALPDLRGRLPLGLDNMGGSAAGRITGLAGEELGNSGGDETVELEVNNLPDHTHDLRAGNGDQFYALSNTQQTTQSDPESIVYDTVTGENAGQALSDVGGVLSATTGTPVNILNPFLAINYIIWTGAN